MFSDQLEMDNGYIIIKSGLTDQLQVPLLKVFLQREMYQIKYIVKLLRPHTLVVWCSDAEKYLSKNNDYKLSS